MKRPARPSSSWSISAIIWWRSENQISAPNSANPALSAAAYQIVSRKPMERVFMRESSWLLQHISEAAYSANQLRFAGVDLQPQLSHEDLQCVFGDCRIESPYRFKNCFATDHPAVIPHKKLE